MSLRFAPETKNAIPLFVIDQNALGDWATGQTLFVQNALSSAGFTAKTGTVLLIPGPDGTPDLALAGYGSKTMRKRQRFPLAAAAQALPEGVYKLACDLPEGDIETEALGWLLTGYAFDRYHMASGSKAQLICPNGVDAATIETIANAEALTRNLINTPACDMGPEQLEHACREVASRFDASITVTTGDALLDANFPMIHAVGRAADQAPRLIDMQWGSAGPKLTLVGKGVCFDTGGLNLKPGASMGLMKKDMGGAATVLGLAQMVMARGLPLQLRVLIPAVENSVSSNSMRPGDILTSRKGLTVEINNTDAEGRLVLADALALADEEDADLILSMATLTGAARVAVGPDLAPYFTDAPDVSTALEEASVAVGDPVWRMPFWPAYETMIEPGIADLDNAPAGGFAGAITAALFLRRFIDNPSYTHFDIYGWNKSAQPARTKGGVGMGARAILQALPKILDM